MDGCHYIMYYILGPLSMNLRHYKTTNNYFTYSCVVLLQYIGLNQSKSHSNTTEKPWINKCCGATRWICTWMTRNYEDIEQNTRGSFCGTFLLEWTSFEPAFSVQIWIEEYKRIILVFQCVVSSEQFQLVTKSCAESFENAFRCQKISKFTCHTRTHLVHLINQLSWLAHFERSGALEIASTMMFHIFPRNNSSE